MVEKTRRSVSVLRRCQESDREELNYWRRRSSEQEDPRKGGSGSAPFSKTHSPHSAESGGYHYIFSHGGMRQKPVMLLSFLWLPSIVVDERGIFFFMCPGMNPNQWKSVSCYSSQNSPKLQKQNSFTLIAVCGLAVLFSKFLDTHPLTSATLKNESESNFVCVLRMRFGCWTPLWAPLTHFQWPRLKSATAKKNLRHGY